MITLICLQCTKKFKIWPYRKDTAKFCSNSCNQKYQWLQPGYRERLSEAHIGLKASYPWKKGDTANELNSQWKGDKVGYWGLHKWIQRHLGKPTTCENCGKENLTKMKIHWANKSRKYLRIKSDWIRLCAKCHYAYDRKSTTR